MSIGIVPLLVLETHVIYHFGVHEEGKLFGQAALLMSISEAHVWFKGLVDTSRWLCTVGDFYELVIVT